MSLRRVDTTFDLPEAHIIVGLLRSEGVEAHLFDADFVRQDWFKAIAYGGYRILVPDRDLTAAHRLIRAYREVKTPLSSSDDAPCPVCSSTNYRDDPRPRRWVFALYILLPFVQLPVLSFARPSNIEQFFWFFPIVLTAYVALALLAIAYLKHGYLCDNCGHRWHDPHRHAYSMLDRAHAAASNDYD
jgi:hypothetical protein